MHEHRRLIHLLPERTRQPVELGDERRHVADHVGEGRGPEDHGEDAGRHLVRGEGLDVSVPDRSHRGHGPVEGEQVLRVKGRVGDRDLPPLPRHDARLGQPRDASEGHPLVYELHVVDVFRLAHHALLQAHKLLVVRPQPEQRARHHVRDRDEEGEELDHTEDARADAGPLLDPLNHLSNTGSAHKLEEAERLGDAQDAGQAREVRVLVRGALHDDEEDEV
mmetsp:Transcript_34119/g.79976  ORF Transcript_34119/g.79976 Transcript_34119/m.79976 type:complete len:221 (-) Transcript_34119:1086-1748(-)